MKYVLVAIIAYFLGNIAGSYFISKIFFKDDIRKYGSGNAGTTNVLRVYGFLPGLITFLIDVCKGILACYIGRLIAPDYGSYIAGFFAVIGHIWPVIINFKGGKGMATSSGTIFYHIPILIPIYILIFFGFNFIFKIMSVTSLLTTVFSVCYVFIFHFDNKPLLIMVVINALLVFYSHRGNIKRLKEGTENKISIGKK